MVIVIKRKMKIFATKQGILDTICMKKKVGGFPVLKGEKKELMKICKLMLTVVMCASILSSCAKHDHVTTPTGYPDGEINRPMVMYNDEIYFFDFTGFNEPLPEGYEFVGSVESIDNLELPLENFEAARLQVGQEIYAGDEELIYVKYENGYAHFQPSEKWLKQWEEIIRKRNGEQELFNEYYQENVGDGTASTIFADLTHDGTEELIILNLGTQTRQEFAECHGDGNLQIVDIIHNRAVMIYEDSFSIGTHQGNRWYYLYEKEGKEYIYKYTVGIYGGVGNVFRELFSFDEYGQQEWAVLDEMFYNSGPSATDVAAEQEKMKQFLKESLVYEDEAMPLVKVGHRMYAEELIDGAEYYDMYVHEGNELKE